MRTQKLLQPATQNAADDVEGNHQQGDLEPQPIAPRQKLQGGDDDANDEGERTPDDPPITPVAPRRIQIGPPAHHQADAQGGEQPAGIAYKIKQHRYAPASSPHSERRPSAALFSKFASERLRHISNFGNGALAVPILDVRHQTGHRLLHTQDTLEPAADETTNDVEHAD